MWYLDDRTLCGSADDLLSALIIIEQDGPPRGLYLNREKFFLHIPEDTSSDYNPLPAEIPIARDGLDLLGVPFGSFSFRQASVLKRVSKLQESLKPFPDLQDSQIKSTLLCSCLALPKITYVP